MLPTRSPVALAKQRRNPSPGRSSESSRTRRFLTASDIRIQTQRQCPTHASFSTCPCAQYFREHCADLNVTSHLLNHFFPYPQLNHHVYRKQCHPLGLKDSPWLFAIKNVPGLSSTSLCTSDRPLPDCNHVNVAWN